MSKPLHRFFSSRYISLIFFDIQHSALFCSFEFADFSGFLNRFLVYSLMTGMEKYMFLQKLGEGTFGCVSRAVNLKSGDVVAIKKIKTKVCSWQECLDMKEVKSLQKLNHPNIVKLKEVVQEWDHLYLVFECLECNLLDLMRKRINCRFTEDEIRKYCFQILQALAYMHQKGYFHRDLKPENLLLAKDLTIKIGDLGSAREIDSQPPYTEYVTTRWYRAPEVLLSSGVYDSKVDMWAMGAIMSEFFTFRPLFSGSNASDQMLKICQVIGSPSEESWPEGLDLSKSLNYQFPKFPGVSLSKLIPSASDDVINLISMLCSWNPSKRPTAFEALKHPFFRNCYYIPPCIRFRETSVTSKPIILEKLNDDRARYDNGNSYISNKLSHSFGSLFLSGGPQQQANQKITKQLASPNSTKRNPLFIKQQQLQFMKQASAV